MARFSGIPTALVGLTGVNPTLLAAVNACLENIALLTGQRGDKKLAAQLKGFITLDLSPEMQLKAVAASGKGTIIGGVSVPDHKDYVELIRNVISLREDVASLRATMNALIKQLKD